MKKLYKNAVLTMIFVLPFITFPIITPRKFQIQESDTGNRVSTIRICGLSLTSEDLKSEI